MILKTLGLPVSAGDVDPFTDVSPGQDQSDLFYPDKYVAVVWENHITTGITPTTFGPSANVTRAQFITMVTRAANLSDPPADYTPPFANFSSDHYPWARKAAYAGLLSGLEGMGPNFDFWAQATRGEAVQILDNLLALKPAS